MNAVRRDAPYDVFVVFTDDEDRSEVLRGENAQRRLDHVVVARCLQRITTVSETGQRMIEATLPNLPTKRGGAQHLILFAQSPGYGEILGVASHAL